MPADPPDTVYLNGCVARWQAGDREAADGLVRAVGGRMETLARRMLKQFPNVRGAADTGDVLQGGLVRLLASLRTLSPASTRDFYNLAAAHLRRELLDLARRVGRRPDLARPQAADSDGGPAAGVPAPDPGADDLDRWQRFHEAVEELPAEEREVVGLVFYHGWEQKQIADLFGVSERTARRRWQEACRRLHERLNGEIPGD